MAAGCKLTLLRCLLIILLPIAMSVNHVLGQKEINQQEIANTSAPSPSLNQDAAKQQQKPEDLEKPSDMDEINDSFRRLLAGINIHDLLQRFDPFLIPYLPLLALNGDNFGVSLAVTGINITGISEMEVLSPDLGPPVAATVIIPRLTLAADKYIAGGHINTLPFTGKSYLNITVDKLAFTLSYTKISPWSFLDFCPKANSTIYNFEVQDRLLVDFTNLNPGTPTGDQINHFLSSLATDVCNNINYLLNGPYHHIIDPIVIKAMNYYITNSKIIPGHCTDDYLQSAEDEHGYSEDDQTKTFEDLLEELATAIDDGGISLPSLGAPPSSAGQTLHSNYLRRLIDLIVGNEDVEALMNQLIDDILQKFPRKK